MQKPALLLIDDDLLISESLAFMLRADFEVRITPTREEARKLLQNLPVMPNLALVDLGLPPDPHSPEEGFAMVSELLAFNPKIKILVLSGQDSQKNVQHALSLGAVDFIPKPCDMDLLKTRLNHQWMIFSAEQHKIQDKQEEKTGDCGLIGESDTMQVLFSQVRQFADSPFPVLVMGESGSGKELVAQCLHTQSAHNKESCMTINCAAFTPELLDAQLFGHAKGAYTGAGTARTGFFEEADKGSLILDEIGEMPMELQSKLLRVLENGEYYRLGETRVRKSTARIIASTNRDLREEVRNGRFRSDLYHRLSVLTMQVPPLSERGVDKNLLLAYFQQYYADMGVKFQLDEDAQACWQYYSFPGNVRELRNIVIRLGAKYPNQMLNTTQVQAEFDTEQVLQSQPEQDVDAQILEQINEGDFSLDNTLQEWERRYIDAALGCTEGNLSQAARMLGINRTTLYSKMQRFNRLDD
ncbi:sigma-54-dependent transcriptional regulator [Candidatus Venteria ishoeyi]|uniref:Transcriptional regulatory protein ZraR n=1 Tax=Candidatus Venteria ishoeyi TaxID=1899563 RepID=A0A1H6FEC1_9GAMM|nr:sigma-54 dependent transcriptional regulator [Candidatus Venteria ishoeyi]MDM8546822.1 sigma-54 dependent transcriptional regulator [Candidatus Venteria ishoeyi]SEH08412.1 Transcriptional regulatory protein ZraR [Candidatus Venteria ishoeyi]